MRPAPLDDVAGVRQRAAKRIELFKGHAPSLTYPDGKNKTRLRSNVRALFSIHKEGEDHDWICNTWHERSGTRGKIL